MKEAYEDLRIELIRFAVEDVITDSNEGEPIDIPTP